MKQAIVASALLSLLGCFSLCAGSEEAAPSKEMTNVVVAQMVKAGIAEDLIVTAIAESEPHFRFDLDGLMALQQAVVPDRIVRAMVARQHGEPISGFAPAVATAAGPAVCAWPCWHAPKTGAQSVLPSGKGPVNTPGPYATGLYGFRLGSVAADGGGGFTYSSGLSGLHPNFGGGLSVGVNKYLGIFGQGGYSPLAQGTYCDGAGCAGASAHLTYVAGGVELIATNRSRVVPYARVGAGYGRGVVSFSGSSLNVDVSQGSPALDFGGGIRAYVTRHFGISAGAQVLHFVGSSGGGTVVMPTAGVFAQSK